MKPSFGTMATGSAMLVGLPLLGVVLAGRPLEPYFQFPPQTRYVAHAPFSWAAFAVLALLVAVSVLPPVRRWAVAGRRRKGPPRDRRPFPRWGWIGLFGVLVFWPLAWTRLPLFSGFQAHTFTPLWLSYIVTVNAWTFRQSGKCLLRDRPAAFLTLFPVSAAFWWFFEYLNRFVQNWHYSGSQYGPWTYFALATLSFSTVLPAVASTREWILTGERFRRAFRGCRPVSVRRPRRIALLALAASGAGLAGIGAAPDVLFPLLWVSPLVIFVSLQVLRGEPHVLAGLSRGDWRPVLSAAAAALVCGFFWELWNVFSLARWEYAVPLVHRFQIFEMPVLGYAGYLPFGVECAVVTEMLGVRSAR